eukprot:gene2226-26942_t
MDLVHGDTRAETHPCERLWDAGEHDGFGDWVRGMCKYWLDDDHANCDRGDRCPYRSARRHNDAAPATRRPQQQQGQGDDGGGQGGKESDCGGEQRRERDRDRVTDRDRNRETGRDRERPVAARCDECGRDGTAGRQLTLCCADT